MSEEQLKAFIAKVQADTSLQEQLKAEGADPVAIAKAAGFTIKLQDLQAAASELSDEELEAASGGCGGPNIPLPVLFATVIAGAAIDAVNDGPTISRGFLK